MLGKSGFCAGSNAKRQDCYGGYDLCILSIGCEGLVYHAIKAGTALHISGHFLDTPGPMDCGEYPRIRDQKRDGIHIH